MTGYMFVMGPCFACHKLFTYNADHVPSIRHQGERQAVCRECVALANPRRVANGLDPIVIHPEAYEPQEVD